MTGPVLDWPKVLRVLFYPRREDETALIPPSARPVAFKVEPGLIIGGRLYPAGVRAPVILFFHGNGEIAADYDDLAPLYTRQGITLLVADYRGYGTSGGTPTTSHLLTDAVAIFGQVGRVLEACGLTPPRLYVMGRSLGSAAAIEVALRAGERLAGLIVESGFADTFGLLVRLGLRVVGAEEERDGLSNAAKMSHIHTPTLVIHGQSDVLIPAGDGQELYRCCAATDKKLVLIPGAGHNDLMLVGVAAYSGGDPSVRAVAPCQVYTSLTNPADDGTLIMDMRCDAQFKIRGGKKMKSRSMLFVTLAVLLGLVVGLAGCGGQPESKEINVLCTPQEEWCQGMKQEFEAKYDITVNYVRMSSGEALARIQAEKDNPTFDIWWGGPIDSFIAAKKDGLLEAYNSPNYKNLLDQAKYKDKDNYWVGIYVGTLGFCTNKNWLAKNPGVKAPDVVG